MTDYNSIYSGEEVDAAVTKSQGIEPGAQVNTVTSVNVKTGAVVVNPDDLDDTTTTNKFTSQAEIDKLASIDENAQVNAVDSVNGQQGVVSLTSDSVPEGATNKYASQNRRTLTADDNILSTDDLIFVDATAGNVTVTLLHPVSNTKPVIILRSDNTANTVTIAPAFGTVGGEANQTIRYRQGHTWCPDGVSDYYNI